MQRVEGAFCAAATPVAANVQVTTASATTIDRACLGLFRFDLIRENLTRCSGHDGTMQSLDTDYLVVGAGAMGMAFTDALIDHADVHVTLVDRRHAAGGHWQDAYPFVQLHQASLFYGVASTVLGTGAVQQQRPRDRAAGAGPTVGDPGATTTTSSTAGSSARAGSRSSARASTTPTAPTTS